MTTPEITEIKNSPVPLIVKTSDVARFLCVSLQTVHNLIQSGELKAAGIGPIQRNKRRHVRVTQQSLLRFYKKRFGHSLIDAIQHRFEA
jgi:hypothetical protein